MTALIPSRRRAHMLTPVSLTAAGLLTLPLLAFAAGGDGEYGDLVHDRHEAFEEIGDAAGVFRDQLRGDAPWDTDAQVAAAEVIANYAPQIPTWFPDGSGPQDGYDTDALANVWEDRATFEEIATAFVPKAEAMQLAAASGERATVMAAFRDMGGTCKRCHDDFRAE